MTLLETVLTKRDVIISSWLQQMCQSNEEKTILELAQHRSTLNDVIIQLGKETTETGIKKITNSILEIANGGDCAGKLAAHALQTTLSKWPVFENYINIIPRPKITEILSEIINQNGP